MKKLIYCFALLFLSLTLLAQGQAVQSTENTSFIPEKGDLSIGVDLVPIFMMIFDSENNYEIAPAINFKAMLSEKTALKTEITVNRASASSDNSDISIVSSSYGVAVGPEWRLGTSRVQGYTGVMGAFLYTNMKIKDVNENDKVYTQVTGRIRAPIPDGFQHHPDGNCKLGYRFILSRRLTAWMSNLSGSHLPPTHSSNSSCS